MRQTNLSKWYVSFWIFKVELEVLQMSFYITFKVFQKVKAVATIFRNNEWKKRHVQNRNVTLKKFVYGFIIIPNLK